jgi:hypothetical protein
VAKRAIKFYFISVQRNRKMKNYFLASLISIMVVMGSNVNADDSEVLTDPPKAKEVKAPSFVNVLKKIGISAVDAVKAVEEGRVFNPSSLTSNFRTFGAGYRLYELELKIGGVVLDQVTGFRGTKFTDGIRLVTLPLQVKVRIDDLSPIGLDLSKFQVAAYGADIKTLKMGNDLHLEAFGMKYENNDLDLGKSFGFELLQIKIRQVLDVSDNGDVRLVFGGSFEMGVEGARTSINLNEVEEDRTEANDVYFNTETSVSVGVLLKKKAGLSFEGSIDPNNKKTSTQSSGVRNDYSHSYWGGVLDWKISPRTRLEFKLGKDSFYNRKRVWSENEVLMVEKLDDRNGYSTNAAFGISW